MSGRLSYNEKSVEVSCFLLLKGITRIELIHCYLG